MKKLCLTACALLLCASTARADVITDWNITTGQRIAASAAAGAPRRGPSAVFDFAMVHLAMHNAVQAIEGRFELYCGSVANPTGSPVAAAASAAHAVLIALFPAQAAEIDQALADSLAKYNVTGDPGLAVGVQAAECLVGVGSRLAADNAMRAKPDTFMGGTAPGEWRPTAVDTAGNDLPMTAEFMATFKPFALKDPAQFRASQAPPHLTSGAYAKAYNEVKELGAKNNSSRTQEQTDIGTFFADGPANYWNFALRGLVDSKGLNLGDSARLFALVSAAVADALITAWDSKIAWNFWRPITAIHEGDNDGNPRTKGDPAWQPLFGTPNYPDYTSGANNFSGAVTGMMVNFFGTDEVAFTLRSLTMPPTNNLRHYSRCSDAARDVVDARIYMGIHFRFADAVALRQGKHVANWVFGHVLRPVE